MMHRRKSGPTSVAGQPRREGTDARRTAYKCVGIGVGPANLSLASLLHKRDDVANLFLDKKPSFGWHDGQQIPGASLQVSMAKDLVSLSDPTNDFSFVSYLHEKGRMYHFLNAQFEAVPRQEFRNYLEWAAARNENVLFDEEVLNVEFDGVFALHTNKRTITAENVVVGVGTEPWMPLSGQKWQSSSQFHVSEFVTKGRDLGGKRVAVVGGGQSGAEAFLDLISRPTRELPHSVSWICRRPNYLPIDDSPFTNDFFMPCYSDYFSGLERAQREAHNRLHVLASDGVSESTLRAIYQAIYSHRFIRGDEGFAELYPNREVIDVESSRESGGWSLSFAHNNHLDAVERLEADAVVWATGFRAARMDFLKPIADRFERDGDEYRIDQDYAVQWDGPDDRRVFLQNAARGQRGLADPNLSLIAWRSQRIADRLQGVRGAAPLTSFIKWDAEPAPSGSELRQGA